MGGRVVMKKCETRVVVLAGGTSSERAVSLNSGRACARALARHFPTRLIDVQWDELPAGIEPQRDVVFSTLHGVFGEDGGMQGLLEAGGIAFAGSDAASSALTFDKVKTKQVVNAVGVGGARALEFDGRLKPDAATIVSALGESVVFKPNRSGSSVGLSICANLAELDLALSAIREGAWLVEERIVGREFTVGVLHGRALPVVEIVPKSGVYDYRSKYTRGATEYLAPAPLDEKIVREVQAWAEKSFQICGCRDYARIDFMMTEKNEVIFLEINTLPGMTDTSLLPMGAHCAGIDFTALVKVLVEPAFDRYFANLSLASSV
jgi:D-alanine-D-alanine ligase